MFLSRQAIILKSQFLFKNVNVVESDCLICIIYYRDSWEIDKGTLQYR